MAATLFLGQVLKGQRGLYTVMKQLQDCVWLAMNEHQEKVIAKSVRHFRLQNEQDILLHFQDQTPCIRPLIEEFRDSTVPPTLILRYLDDDALRASNKQRLTCLEVKYVAKNVLEALSVLHDKGFVHTDIKPSNVLVNYGHSDVHFTEVQLADFGSTVHMESLYAQHGDPIGTPIFRSPEAHLQMTWGTATDIWSFNGFHIFKPDVPADHDAYDVMILMKHHRCFGPFLESYEQIADRQRPAVLIWIMQNSPPETLRPFHLTSTQEICQEDKEFVLRAMKLDPRDRPSARQLLEDEWFHHS
ncbi:putative serine/threonine protein kinase [Aspergillus clavatus NRRL 1]|uniref:Protein kinase, putative n=1 Tax=Aspergillus clavatus (strain ATCC 1007 / CBS 513.65 / DSM 816 / NCTC 3887 / NRRL 1 / QM 1276 / 107) TaxID=344612 RepID=A1CC36_ASPCL|nr:protein kinase, putative [Aspergillus clavatus NRRL 1]EAW13304.1 protein kinase, putative [Aspergillus clavatus NRRL 1]